MTAEKPSLEVTEHRLQEERVTSGACYVEHLIPRLVVPNEYEVDRDLNGVPLMFCRALSEDEFKVARQQAIEFGEEFLPLIYQAMVRCLSQKVTKELFENASKAPSGRASEMANYEWLEVYKQRLNAGRNHPDAMSEAVALIRKKYREAAIVSPDSVKKRLKRLIKRDERKRESMGEVNKKLKIFSGKF
jgi:hypothetical protein